MIPGDPACYRGSDVLVNRYDVRDADLLHALEYKFAVARELELAMSTRSIESPEEFNFSRLQSIHRHLFQDVYDWAGEVRQLDFAKRSKETGLISRFTPLNDMGPKIKAFDEFLRANSLQGLSKPEFVRLFAQVHTLLNEIHPFREGNGRSVRVFMSQLARAAGYEFQIEKVDKDKWNLASHKALRQHDAKTGASFPGSMALMRDLLSTAVQPVKSDVHRLAQKVFSMKLEKPLTTGGLPASEAPSHSARGRLPLSTMVAGEVRAVFVKKGYSPQDVESSVQKTISHIDRVLAIKNNLMEATKTPCGQYQRQRA